MRPAVLLVVTICLAAMVAKEAFGHEGGKLSDVTSGEIDFDDEYSVAALGLRSPPSAHVVDAAGSRVAGGPFPV